MRVAALAAVAVSMASQTLLGADQPPAVAQERVYIGTYTHSPRSKGIYVAELDAASGSLQKPALAAAFPNPSFVAIDPGHRYLYAVSETYHAPAVGAFSINPDGTLKELNRQTTGDSPCYVVVDQGSKNVLVANYSSGSVEVFPIGGDGSLQPRSCVQQHVGKSPKAHCIEFDRDYRFALCCDLGLNQLFVYRFDPAAGQLTPSDPPTAPLPPGSGPRHLAFSPDGKFLYVINETALTVTAFSWDAQRGSATPFQTLSTLPADDASTTNRSTAEIIVHPSGKFLYGSNRGHDSIVQFNIDPESGKLALVGHTPTQGKMPRGFGIDITGRWLLAGNQDSDSMVQFEIDPATGKLTPRQTVDLGAPVCMKFVAIK